MISEKRLSELEEKANIIREDIIKMLVAAGSGHSAGPLGFADVMVALYFGDVVNYDPKKPDWPERDRVVLSHGHVCPLLYAVLAHAGFFPHSELLTLRKLNSRLQGHPHYGTLPGIEATAGPLGQGLSQAIGMTLALRLDYAAGKLGETRPHVFCLTGDGELDEGQNWEAVMFAGKNRLGNLTVIVDRNNIQIDGFTEDVMPLEPLTAKFHAFNWDVLEVDGHNIREIIDAVNEAKAIFERPVAILARTIPGKGVDFMLWKPVWHGVIPKPEEAKKALHELRTLQGKIVSEYE